MAKYIKVGGQWKTVAIDADVVQTAYVKVGGSWKGVTGSYVKVAGVWKQTFNYSAYIVPNVVGQVWATGKTNITNSGNIVGTSTIINNAGGATPTNDGKISTQSVAPNAYLTPQTVNLTYYVFTYITVPNIIGQVTSTADTLITNAGNTVGTKTATASGATAGNHNTVASQTVAAGSTYVTAQTVGYSYYNYTVPTPSQPSVALSSKTSTQFTFTTSFGANTTSALAYYGPPGQGNQVFAGNVTYSGQPITVTGLTPGQSYSFMSYPNNTVNVNTLGNVSQGGLPSAQGSVTLDAQPAPTTGSISQSPSSGGVSVGTNISASTSGWDNNPTSVEIKLVRGTAGVVEGEDPSNNPRATGSGSTSAALSYVVTTADYNSGSRYFRAFARASNAGGTSGWIQTFVDIGPIANPVQPPTNPGTPTGSDNLSPVGGTFSWGASSGTGTITYTYQVLYSNGSQYSSGITTNTFVQVPAAGTFNINVYASDNTGLNSATVYSSNYTFTAIVTTTAPTASASNTYNGDNNPWSWTLSITHTGGSVPTSWRAVFETGSSSSGPALATANVSGSWSAGTNGTQQVTRNSFTYSWGRWSNVYVSNSAGETNASGSPTAWQ